MPRMYKKMNHPYSENESLVSFFDIKHESNNEKKNEVEISSISTSWITEPFIS